MRILAIETSCDETAIAFIEARSTTKSTRIKILGNALLSQVKLHEQYGGVFPMMAKREHAKSLAPLLQRVLEEARELNYSQLTTHNSQKEKSIRKILEREGNLAEELLAFTIRIKKPSIDYLAVTNGPGLEPTLWVGINFAKALSLFWDIPLIPINHMEGHVISAMLKRPPTHADRTQKDAEKLPTTNYQLQTPSFPLLALLISGGHTELVVAKKFGSYTCLGQTRDDAVGEAFDKVARMLNLPYPGGPQISRLAEESRQLGGPTAKLARFKLPRPMIHSSDLDFSFAGLKTAVLYTLKKLQLGRLTSKLSKLDIKTKKMFALEFENAATEVLIAKTKKALIKTDAKTLIIGGGVSANTHIRREFQKLLEKEFSHVTLAVPSPSLSTDNALMIALAAYTKVRNKKTYVTPKKVRAEGNLRL